MSKINKNNYSTSNENHQELFPDYWPDFDYSCEDNDDSNPSDAHNTSPNIYEDFSPINNLLTIDPTLDLTSLFMKANEVGSINMRHAYQPPLNQGTCWNCYRSYKHRCCAACKKVEGECDCAFICGLTRPTGSKDKSGNYNQYEKCKWYTSDIKNLTHDCKGMVKGSAYVLFLNEQRYGEFQIENKKYCYRCKKNGHFSYQCPEVVCYVCNQSGHLARDCRAHYSITHN